MEVKHSAQYRNSNYNKGDGGGGDGDHNGQK